MRCSKCGRISFDYLENCSNCGQDLRKISAGLGSFTKPDTELMWFSKDFKADSIKTEPIVEQETGNSIDLSEIDVSDLVDASTIDTDVKEIDPGDLKTVADDKGFQQALDQVLKDE